ncbi:hypothetical protein CMQ_822 [Grosmannia clavigera kw1407]|uniref:Uncharacterized protein n=1 Tax=Grosmannia clavigera (strain kw1407 / UAMH 11150) TaxID=655863 RepID=F0XC71_GROCL|nr:uncharacterized protein CMQ_822 [Grosmannia clavigera kw1407]EFX03894.1 hypothetical protein CMQ_822 [Grosmannia clavigera kw1407]
MKLSGSIASWLLFARLMQLLASLAAVILGGLLLVWADGLSTETGSDVSGRALVITRRIFFVCSEGIASVLLIYVAASCVLILRSYRQVGSRLRLCLAASVGGDVLMSGLDLAVATLLAAGGTTSQLGNCPVVDRRLCLLQQSFYWVAIAIIFTYLATITLTSLQIYKLVRHRQEGSSSRDQPESPLLGPIPAAPLRPENEELVAPSPSPEATSVPEPSELPPSAEGVSAPPPGKQQIQLQVAPYHISDVAAAATIMDGSRFQSGHVQLHNSTSTLPSYSPREDGGGGNDTSNRNNRDNSDNNDNNHSLGGCRLSQS